MPTRSGAGPRCCPRGLRWPVSAPLLPRCPYLHRTTGDTERKYHLRYYKTGTCIHETDARGHCVKNGLHCAFAHGPLDLRPPVCDIRCVGRPRGAAGRPASSPLWDAGLSGSLSGFDSDERVSVPLPRVPMGVHEAELVHLWDPPGGDRRVLTKRVSALKVLDPSQDRAVPEARGPPVPNLLGCSAERRHRMIPSPCGRAWDRREAAL